ncbi:hypothetical protein DFH09DRAFT_1483893 [Mycena vulgaris]|nr:hypothetical protein DFH09DRAFT_1483893 [Mycena vulgaris]
MCAYARSEIAEDRKYGTDQPELRNLKIDSHVWIPSFNMVIHLTPSIPALVCTHFDDPINRTPTRKAHPAASRRGGLAASWSPVASRDPRPERGVSADMGAGRLLFEKVRANEYMRTIAVFAGAPEGWTSRRLALRKRIRAEAKRLGYNEARGDGSQENERVPTNEEKHAGNEYILHTRIGVSEMQDPDPNGNIVPMIRHGPGPATWDILHNLGHLKFFLVAPSLSSCAPEAVARDAAFADSSPYQYTSLPSLASGSDYAQSSSGSSSPSYASISPGYTSPAPSTIYNSPPRTCILPPPPPPALRCPSPFPSRLPARIPAYRSRPRSRPPSRAPSSTASQPYPKNPTLTGPRYPSSAGVSFGGANPIPPPDSATRRPSITRQPTPLPRGPQATPPRCTQRRRRVRCRCARRTRDTTNTMGGVRTRGAARGSRGARIFEWSDEITDDFFASLLSFLSLRRHLPLDDSLRSHAASLTSRTPAHKQDDIADRMSALSISAPRIDGLPYTSHASPVAYPALARHMTSHQRTQSYVPGAWGSSLPPAAPSFAAFAVGAGAGLASVGARVALDAARAAAASSSTAAYLTSFAPPQDLRERAQEDAIAATRAAAVRADAERAERENSPYPRLRTVVLPQATLPRFLGIARANSARNLQSCGLLLGREVMRGANDGSGKPRFVVETMLIPGQHATSDTCTMECFTNAHPSNTIVFHIFSRFSHARELPTDATRVVRGRVRGKVGSQLRDLPPHRPTRPPNGPPVHREAGVPPASQRAHLYGRGQGPRLDARGCAGDYRFAIARG